MIIATAISFSYLDKLADPGYIPSTLIKMLTLPVVSYITFVLKGHTFLLHVYIRTVSSLGPNCCWIRRIGVMFKW